MKTALLFRGFFRNGDFYAEKTLKNVVKPNNCDLFSVTWNLKQVSKFGQIDSNEVNENYIESFYGKHKKIKVLDFDFYQKNKVPFSSIDRPNDVFKTDGHAAQHGVKVADRLKDVWYAPRIGLDLILEEEKESGEKYDIIILHRYDFAFEHVLELKNDDYIHIPARTSKLDSNDLFAYGNRDNMIKYLSLYDQFDELYEKYNYNVTYAERLLTQYLELNNLKSVKEDGWDYFFAYDVRR